MKNPQASILYLLFLFFYACTSSDPAPEQPVLSDIGRIESFAITIDGTQYGGTINHASGEVTVILPFRTQIIPVVPAIKISENATILPSSGLEQSFDNPVVYSVTAENGDTKQYSITITIAPNFENSITDFKIQYLGDFISGHIDEYSSTILVEMPNNFDLSKAIPSFEISENASANINSEEAIDLSDSFIVQITAENGSVRNYTVSAYTPNLLTNPTGGNNGEGWNFDQDSGVEIESGIGNIFYIVANFGSFGPRITQAIDFPRDYSGKYVLFIGNLTTEKTMPDSITRHPYLWAYQLGDFEPEEWIYMQGMTHLESANVWETVHGIHELLPNNVTGTFFHLAQGRRNGDPYDGTKSKYRDLEVRLFEKKSDAEIFVEHLYAKKI